MNLKVYTHKKGSPTRMRMCFSDVFNLYSENIMRHLGGVGGLVVDGYTLNTLRYADDIVLIIQSNYKKC